MSALLLEEKIKAAADAGKKTVEKWWEEIHAWFDAEEAKTAAVLKTEEKKLAEKTESPAAPQTASGTSAA